MRNLKGILSLILHHVALTCACSCERRNRFIPSVSDTYVHGPILLCLSIRFLRDRMGGGCFSDLGSSSIPGAASPVSEEQHQNDENHLQHLKQENE